jgi:ketosteroid isomerase-like protein
VGESNVELAARLFERASPQGVESALELLTEDVVSVVPPTMSAEPDVYEGHDGARRYFGGFEGFLEDVRFVPLEFIEAADDVVIAMIELHGRGVSSGIETVLPAAVVLWVADGKIRRIEAHPDLEAAHEAMKAAP